MSGGLEKSGCGGSGVGQRVGMEFKGHADAALARQAGNAAGLTDDPIPVGGIGLGGAVGAGPDADHGGAKCAGGAEDAADDFFRAQLVESDGDEAWGEVKHGGSARVLDHFFQLHGVGSEEADALGEFFGSHGIFVHHPAEGFFIDGDFFDGGGVGVLWAELTGEGFGVFLEFLEEIGADGEEVAAGEFADFPDVAEAGPHDFGSVAEFLVIVVDRANGEDAGVFGGGEVFAGGFLMPVENASDEGRDELDFALGAGDGLGEGEEEGEVAVDAVFLKDFCGTDAFPGGGNFDQDAFAVDASFFVKGNEFAGFGCGGGGVEGEAGIDLSGDASGDDLEDF